MIAAVAVLVFSGAAIYFASDFFVNGIEWLGRKLGVSETATGTLLAAIGTALPESVITFVALALGDKSTDTAIGIGAALGGPLVLSTLAYGVIGLAMIGGDRGKAMSLAARAEGKWLVRVQLWFLVIFGLKIGLGVVAFPHKSATGIGFLIIYAWFAVTQFSRSKSVAQSKLGPLKIAPRRVEPRMVWVLAQTLASLVVVFVASRLFVDRLGDVAQGLGMPPGEVALFLSPMATELPEMMNALIWVRQGKLRLALANVSGAMMVQATVPTAFGLLYSPWLLDRVALMSAAVTAAAIVWQMLLFRSGRVSGRTIAEACWFFAAFVASTIWLA
jgi:cation:H+ antiporter